MTSKRSLEHPVDQGVVTKRIRTRDDFNHRSDVDNVFEKINERILPTDPSPSKHVFQMVDDCEVTDGFFEIKYEPKEIKDEPVVCELPIDIDDNNPLRPFKDEEDDQVKEELVKTEVDDFENNLNQHAEEEEKSLLHSQKSEDAQLPSDGVNLAGVAPTPQKDNLVRPSTSIAALGPTGRQKCAPRRVYAPKFRGGFETSTEGGEENKKEPHDESNLRKKAPGNRTTRTEKWDTEKARVESDRGSIVQLLVDPTNHHLLLNCSKEHEDNIIRKGRATPLMALMGAPARCSQTPLDGFWPKEEEYEKIPWLTGLRVYLRYYCWPCLLFTRERWSFRGGEPKEKFWESVNTHSAYPLHRVAEANLKLRQAELDSSNPPDVENRAVGFVTSNRAFLALLLRILVSKKTKFNNTASDFDGYGELMKVAITYAPELQQFKTRISDDHLSNFVNRHAPKLLHSIKTKMAAKIHEETEEIPFVSIIYEDTENVVDKSSLVAVILRYVTENGEIFERFVKFVKIGPSRNAYDVLEMHLAVVEEFGLREKLVGYTFSGTVVAPASVDGFFKVMQSECPKATFFHHPDHNLKELLLQSLSHLEECQRFLEVISDLVKFFWTNPGAIPTLVTFIKHCQPDCQGLEDPKSFTVNIISTIRRYYPHVIQFFYKVSQKFWNDEVAKDAPIFMKFLQEPLNRFLIAVIASVLDAVDDLCKTMEKGYNAKLWKTQASQVIDTLNRLLENGVKRFVYSASNGKMQLNQNQSVDVNIPKFCPGIFKKVVKTALNCVHHRAAKADTFYLNGKYSRVVDIFQAPDVWRRYGLQFATLDEFNQHMEFFKVCITAFAGKSVPETVKAVANMERAPKFQLWWGFLRFCALAVSPSKSAASSPSAVLRLKTYLKDKQEFRPTEVLMFLERGLLRDQLTNNEFVEDVITEYAEKNNECDFLDNSSETAKSVSIFE